MNEWVNAEAHAERAHQFYEAGQWEKALTELKRALAVNPQQSEWHFGMGLTLEAMGRHADAASSFQRVLDLRGEDVETMVNLALNLNRADQPKRALRVLERVNQIDANCESGYCLRVEAYARLHDHEKAEEMFYMARQIVEECPACYDYIAHSLAKRGMMDKALWCWHQTVRLEPYYPGVYASLARVHWQRGHHVRAQRLFLKQLRQDPGDVDTLLELGRLLTEMGRDAEAGEKFRRVLELDSSIAEARLALGELAVRANDLETAQRELEAARRLGPQLPGVCVSLAQVAFQREQFEAAVALIDDELRLQDHLPLHLLDAARLLIDMESPKRVPEFLTPLIDQYLRDPAHREEVVTALHYRGVARSMLGQLERGVADYRRAVRLEPNHTLAMQNLVLAYIDKGRLDHATYWLRRAERVLPGDPMLRQLQMRIVVKRVSQMFLGARRPTV